MDQVYSALQLAGVGQGDIQASSISAYPRYNWVDGTSSVVGYTVYLSLTVNIANIHLNNQKIAKVVDALATAGVSYISGISYDTINPNAGKSTARVYAWNEALLRAKQYAKLAVRTLGKVLIIEEVSTSYYPYYYSAGNVASGQLGDAPVAASSSPALPTGRIVVSVVVLVYWELI